jgi:hypothetical protein
LQPNTTYYYTFRTTDVHNNISNPTSIYKVTLRDDAGAVYPEIEVLQEFESNIQKDSFKNLKKYIHIVPYEVQITIETQNELESANNLAKLKLGFAEDPVWDKKFKIRLRSKSTGKIIDFNVTFTNNEIRE